MSEPNGFVDRRERPGNPAIGQVIHVKDHITQVTGALQVLRVDIDVTIGEHSVHFAEHAGDILVEVGEECIGQS